MDTSVTFGDHSVYVNDRLNGTFYLVYFDAHNRWILHDGMPDAEQTTVDTEDILALCNEDVDLPTQCNECWSFWESFGAEEHCDGIFSVVNSSDDMTCTGFVEPDVENVSYTQEIRLCFEDEDFNTMEHDYTGDWVLTGEMFNGRAVWSHNHSDSTTVHYLYYSETWRC